MAKALFGHVGVGPDTRLVTEIARLRGRLAELEDEVARLRRTNEMLVSAVRVHEDVLSLSVPETAEALA